MSTTDTSLNVIIAAAKQVVAAKLALLAESLDAQPDNPGIIKRVPHGFILSAASMGLTSWDPFYHDWKGQYAQVQQYLQHALMDAPARTALASIAKHGKDQYQKTTRTYHPEVLRVIGPLTAEVTSALNAWYGADSPSTGDDVSP